MQNNWPVIQEMFKVCFMPTQPCEKQNVQTFEADSSVYTRWKLQWPCAYPTCKSEHGSRDLQIYFCFFVPKPAKPTVCPYLYTFSCIGLVPMHYGTHSLRR